MIEKDKIGQPTTHKKLTDEDLTALQDILGNITVTRTGMLRVMAFLVQNPDWAEKTSDLVYAVEQMSENIKVISKEIVEIRKFMQTSIVKI